MVFNTLTVGAAVTPSVIETYFSHYLQRTPLKQKPTAHISYHEGLRLIREFLDYSSKHSVEDLQSFTAQWVPSPQWVRINDAEIAPKFLDRAARLLQRQLGTRGMEVLGGKTWWTWRRPESPLRAEWIEMKKEFFDRKLTGAKCERVILYVHGGAYYFGSVDEHRYQMQRHARKLRARVLAPRYRLAPQFPFPCGLYDCLATYYYLLEHFEPSQILFAGDSAGGGMVLSMLVTLRDQEQPLPTGTILLSPWVDLTHSFPSVAGDGLGDYIPAHGFHHKPSMAWPPPPEDGEARRGKKEGGEGMPAGVVELPAAAATPHPQQQNGVMDGDENSVRNLDEEPISALPSTTTSRPATPAPRFGEPLTINLDGKAISLNEQIQLYAPNHLLAHPLVSPIMQPSLGGLPPMLIQVGGAELLRDEQIYLAHKAAHPSLYPPNETIMREFDPSRSSIDRWPPTDVQLQLWEDLCHVPHTLSFTRPAKYMYRSVAQFAAWALARAQERGVDIQNDDAVSFISSGGEEDDASSVAESVKDKAMGAVGKAGDPLPQFKDHMIRQRVTRHGIIYPLAPVSEISCLALDPASIGVPKAGPVRKWLAARQASDQRFANERRKIEKKRAKEMSQGYDVIPGEHPPATALVNRRRKGVAPEEKKKGRSWGLAMWSGWGSSHDEATLQREEKTEKDAAAAARKESASASNPNLLAPNGGAGGMRRRTSSVSAVSSRLHLPWATASRDRLGSSAASARRGPHEEVVVDEGQAGERGLAAMVAAETAAVSPLTPPPGVDARGTGRPTSSSVSSPIPVEQDSLHARQKSRNANDAPIAIVPTTSVAAPASEKIVGTENSYLSPTSSRPHNGVYAYPFTLREAGQNNPSTVTLDSQVPSHNELQGDAPKPVELPSAAESQSDGDEVESEQRAASADDSRSSAASPDVGSTSTREQAKVEGDDEIGSPITPVNGFAETTHEEVLVSPVDPPSTQPKIPFKLRNPVFDQRTSMLGSIGADGMPNAHYAFLRDDSPKRQLRGEDSTAEVGNTKADESAKLAPAPFKMRHTVYDPDVTLPPSKAVDHSNIPEHNRENSDPLTTTSTSRIQRESGALGLQLGDHHRIVGDQMDQPPAYESAAAVGPRTNVIFPETVARRPIVKQILPEEDGGEEERPPPPPPKDEEYLSKGRKVAGTRKVNGGVSPVNGVATSPQVNGGKYSPSPVGGAPAIGDLSFERPTLETFVTASDGTDLHAK